LASTSLAALLVGGSVPSAWAACATNITGSVTGCTNAGVITGINVHDATVSGTILNTGVIQSNGISVNTASTINGAIADTGTLFGGISVDHTSKVAATLTGIAAVGPTFGGGITNAGTVSAGTGILVGGLGNTFLGGVTNSGTLSAGGNGILVTGAAVFGAAGAGGITNSGTITGGNFNYGTLVQGVTAFNAAIDNSSGATITAGRGIGVSSVSVFGNSVSGGITNAGNITAKARTGAGIFATGVSTFIGNVSNSGTITANGASGIGIFLRQVATFQGAVSNSGTISAHFIGIGVSSATVFGSASAGGGITNSGVISVSNGTGISVQHVSTFYGNVSNSGTILAANTGIFICNCVTLAGGGVTNTGTISAFAGIVLNDHSAVSVFDSGTIVSTGGIGGTAVDLRNAGPGNTFTLGPGYNITGNVLGAGSDTFQLGGTGSGNFNLSNIGSSQQYQGFTTFNEVGSATWTVTGTFSPTNPWTVQSGTLIIEGSLGNASGVTLSGGTIVIGSNNALGSGTLSMAPGTTLSFLNTANFTVANPITISGDPFFTPPAGTTQTISGAIGNGGSPGVLEMSGAGTLVLSGVNSYSGGTTISSGVLQVTNNNSVGTGTVTLSGGALQAGGAGLSFGNAFAINTTGGTIDTQANTLTLSGAIGNGNGSTGALTKIGSGTLILSGTSNYTGATNVNGGILQAGAANALAPASAFTIASGATLNLNKLQ